MSMSIRDLQFFLFGASLGMFLWNWAWRRWAIDAGKAEFYLDGNRKKWRWKP